MKQSEDETNSAFGLLDSQEATPQERFDPETAGQRSATSLRLIVSCGDQGLARDYFESLNVGPGRASMAGKAELLSPDSFLQRFHGQDLRPAEIVIFLDHRITNQVLSLFSGLSQPDSQVSFNCLIVLPSLHAHLCPGRSDGMQELLDQLCESFRQVSDRLNSPIDTQGAGLPTSDSFSLGTGESLAVLKAPGSRLVVIRTGYVFSPSSSMTSRLKSLRPLRALTGPQLSSTFVPGTTLFSAINSELESLSPLRGRAPNVKAVASSAPEIEPSFQSKNGRVESSVSSHATSCEEASDSGQNSRFRSIRHLTILGVRRSWQSVLAERAAEQHADDAESLLSILCRSLGVQWFIAVVIRMLIRLMPSARQVDFHTLKPRTVREIISLYNRHNCRDIQLAGYNNGVNHFGWKFSDKTVVLTTGLPGKTQLSDASMLDLEARLRASGLLGETNSRSDNDIASSRTHFTVDAGLTLKHCIQELNRHDREFYVVPNYSWISMGTLFFVPVHGSGSHVSTLGDTIEDVLLYDGESEQFIFARRGDRLFRDAMYDTSRHRLLLRLTLLVKPKSVYSVKHETVDDPSAEDILKVFEDPDASNVEIRKNRAANSAIDIRRYYVDSPATAGALKMPRDSIGRVWDRLEETPVASTLFHWFVRKFAFHVELFLQPEEFLIFWQQHKSLPISKLQLRQILKDGITHSACRQANCISADLFMTRSNRDVFLGFISTHLPNVRFNPGKQSL